MKKTTKRICTQCIGTALTFFMLAGVILVTACGTPPAKPFAVESPPVTTAVIGPILVDGIAPMDPQPAPGNIAPGLSVTYFRSFKTRDLADLPRGELARDVGRPGPPIPYLNHAFGKGEVFDSGEKILIGMSMRGMLRFPQAGRYALKAFVNDGILLYLGGKLVLDEPKWNKEGDRYTITAAIDAEADAWYPLLIEYFQRKGTATLKLYWRTPQSEDFAIVPREAFGYMKEGR